MLYTWLHAPLSQLPPFLQPLDVVQIVLCITFSEVVQHLLNTTLGLSSCTALRVQSIPTGYMYSIGARVALYLGFLGFLDQPKLRTAPQNICTLLVGMMDIGRSFDP
jgi:hypothetical protein